MPNNINCIMYWLVGELFATPNLVSCLRTCRYQIWTSVSNVLLVSTSRISFQYLQISDLNICIKCIASVCMFLHSCKCLDVPRSCNVQAFVCSLYCIGCSQLRCARVFVCSFTVAMCDCKVFVCYFTVAICKWLNVPCIVLHLVVCSSQLHCKRLYVPRSIKTFLLIPFRHCATHSSRNPFTTTCISTLVVLVLQVLQVLQVLHK